MRYVLALMRPVFALFISFYLIAGSSDTGRAQSGAPTIVNFQIQRTAREGKNWLVFTWDVSNVDRVTLLHDGKELPSRIQLADGSFGWPPNMPGGFETTGTTGTYTLVAENQSGRVEARGKYQGKSCFAWLVPPGNHWTRCRRGGQIASNLSTDVKPGRPSCTVTGHVTSSLNFMKRVPKNPHNPAAGTTTFRLDKATYRRVGSKNATWLRLSGRGGVRRYRFSGIPGGHDYVVSLQWVWPTKPKEVRFHCPSSPGEHVIKLRPLHNFDFRNDS